MVICCGEESDIVGFEKTKKGKWEFHKCNNCNHTWSHKKRNDNKKIDKMIDGIIKKARKV